MQGRGWGSLTISDLADWDWHLRRDHLRLAVILHDYDGGRHGFCANYMTAFVLR
jgi:hypothetical protein